jgi:hypothetical protein
VLFHCSIWIESSAIRRRLCIKVTRMDLRPNKIIHPRQSGDVSRTKWERRIERRDIPRHGHRCPCQGIGDNAKPHTVVSIIHPSPSYKVLHRAKGLNIKMDVDVAPQKGQHCFLFLLARECVLASTQGKHQEPMAPFRPSMIRRPCILQSRPKLGRGRGNYNIGNKVGIAQEILGN